MNQIDAQEPTRLIEDPGLDALLREDLEIARQNPALSYDPAQLQAGLTRLETAIGGASTVPPGGSLAGVRSLGWFAGVAAVIGAGALALWLLGPEAAQPELSERAPVVSQSPHASQGKHEMAAASLGAPTHAEAVELEPVEDAPSPAALAVDEGAGGDAPGLDGPRRPAGSHSTNAHEDGEPSKAAAAKGTTKAGGDDSGKAAPPSAGTLADEAAQLNEARKALTQDPAKTLALAEAGEREFPKGALTQERRGYAILALIALDRRGEAEQRADAYLQRWPKGALSRRIREALQN